MDSAAVFVVLIGGAGITQYYELIRNLQAMPEHL